MNRLLRETLRPAALARLLLGMVAQIAIATVPASAEPTHVTVRVLSKGAKFIGSSMGGVQVTIKDAETGEILADGVAAGGTGDTTRIMKGGRSGKTSLFTEGAAEFRAEIDLDGPRRVEVIAYGPLAHPRSANRVSSTQWIMPGKHVSRGDAWLLEMPGLIVEARADVADTAKAPAQIAVHATVMMMCGCPIGPDTSWNSKDFEIRATVSRDGEKIAEVPLAYAGTHSRFRGVVDAAQPGSYEAVVYGYQRDNGNTGVDRIAWVVEP
jgi:hypothetical protein